MQAFELTTHVDKQGHLRLPDHCQLAFGKAARVILLIEETDTSGADAPETPLSRFAGRLKDSPSFQGDPVEIQRAMRDDWE